ncbi:MAG: DNA polymerase III subunit chi [Burkholderiales bacterium]|jgi:DNA polymerase-3 subunit chi|nr:DNA polymerase III subunit chi [Burkholderiales bacterium]
MTEIAFHFNADEKLSYACRLLRKATGSGARVVVTGSAEQLGQLDQMLWTFGALEFVPHCRAGASAELLARTPVVLASQPAQAPHAQVLLNLGDAVPEEFGRFERLIEVVTHDEDDRGLARRRWKHYADRGYAIVRHDLKPREAA